MQADRISLCDNVFSILFSDVNVGEMSNTAVMEARKWLEEKKSGSSSKYKVSSENSLLNCSYCFNLQVCPFLRYLVSVL